jgi:hypothetical protein
MNMRLLGATLMPLLDEMHVAPRKVHLRPRGPLVTLPEAVHHVDESMDGWVQIWVVVVAIRAIPD